MTEANRESESVELLDHSPDWKEAYEAEGVRLLEAVGDSVRAIEHVGATAVEGIPARPIVDIAIGVDSLEAAGRHVVPLQELGYDYLGEAGIDERRLFRKRAPDAFDVELVVYRGERWRERLALRDYLRAHPDDVEQLARAKRDLAERSEEAYTREKRALLEDWTEKALSWRREALDT